MLLLCKSILGSCAEMWPGEIVLTAIFLLFSLVQTMGSLRFLGRVSSEEVFSVESGLT